jgi:hypothetical protein
MVVQLKDIINFYMSIDELNSKTIDLELKYQDIKMSLLHILVWSQLKNTPISEKKKKGNKDVLSAEARKIGFTAG